MPNILDGFVEMSFENGKDITAQQIDAEYVKGNNFLYIELTDNKFAPNINLPNSNSLDPLKGSIIKIVNNSAHLSTLYYQVETAIFNIPILSSTDVSVYGHPGLGWDIRR